MLSITAVDTKGNEISLNAVESLLICMDADTPCDSLTAVFSDIIREELAQIVLSDKGKTVYRGIVDEQTVYVGESVKTEIIARSMAALLVDNEALPMTYRMANSEILFRRYLKPLGIDSYTDEQGKALHLFTVAKGDSCWQAAENFSKKIYGCIPRVEDNVLHFEGVRSEREVVFSNTPESRYTFTRLEYNRRRCKLISKVNAKVRSGGDYTCAVKNTSVQDKSVVRERYVNAVKSPVKYISGEQGLFTKSNSEYESLVLYTPCCHTDLLGAKVRVKGSADEEISGFRVVSVRYSFTHSGESTKLILKKEN